jgi:proline iminopeptidase
MAWQLHKRWSTSQFILIDDEGHGGPKMIEAMVDAVAQFLGRGDQGPVGASSDA